MEEVGPRGRAWIALDDAGRLIPTEAFRGRAKGELDTEAGLLTRQLAFLLGTGFGVLGCRSVAVEAGHLAMVTLREHAGCSLEFWAGAALRAEPSAALFDATTDAILGPWHDSVIVGGAARLVAESACRAAMVIDDAGVT